MPQHSPILAETNAWNNADSLGFQTWRRHTNASLAASNPIMQRRQNRLLTVYNRHSSFAGLITRHPNEGSSGADASRLNFGQYGRQRGISGTGWPDTPALWPKRLPLDSVASPAPRQTAGANISEDEPAGEVRNIPALLSKAAIVTESHPSSLPFIAASRVPESHSPIGAVFDSPDKGDGVWTDNKGASLPLATGPEHSVIRRWPSISSVSGSGYDSLPIRSSKHIARKISLSDSSQPLASNITTSSFYRSARSENSVEGRHAGAGAAFCRPTRPAIAMSHQGPDLQAPRPLLLMRALATPGSIPGSMSVARQLPNTGPAGVEFSSLLPSRFSSSLPSVFEAIRRKPATRDLSEIKFETKTPLWPPPANDTMDESTMVELESTKPSPTRVASLGHAHAGNSIPASRGPIDYVLQRADVSSPITGRNPTLIKSDLESAAQPLQSSETSSLQRDPLSGRNWLRNVSLHLALPSRLSRSVFPASHSVPDTGRDFLRPHALTQRAPFQSKQTYGEHLKLREASFQRTANTRNDPGVEAFATKSISLPADYSIPRVDSDSAPDAQGMIHLTVGQPSTSRFTVQRFGGKTHPLAGNANVISTHTPIKTSSGQSSKGGLPGLSSLLPAPLPLNSAIQLARPVLRKPLKAAASGTYAPGTPRSQDDSASFYDVPQETMAGSGAMISGGHHTEPGASYILRREDRGASFDAPVSGTVIHRLPGNPSPMPLSLPFGIYRRRTVGISTGSAGSERMRITNSNSKASAETHSIGEQPGISPTQGKRSSHGDWTSSEFAERPLALVQRSPNKLMRAPGDAVSTLPHSTRAEDRFGLVSPPSEHSDGILATSGEVIPSAMSASEVVDPEEMAEKVWRIMAERLVTEQERQGLGKWL